MRASFVFAICWRARPVSGFAGLQQSLHSQKWALMLMRGIIRGITPSPDYVTFVLEVEGKKYGRTYTGPQYRNYPPWGQLKIDDEVDGLRWKNQKKGLIDADSPVYLLQGMLF